MSEAVQIDISVAQPDKAASVLEAMASATEKLAKREAEYQAQLAKREGIFNTLEEKYKVREYNGGNGSSSVYGPPRGQSEENKWRERFEQNNRAPSHEPPPHLAPKQPPPSALAQALGQQEYEKFKRMDEQRLEKLRGQNDAAKKIEEYEEKRRQFEQKQQGPNPDLMTGKSVEMAASGLTGLGKAALGLIASFGAVKSVVESVGMIAHYSQLKYTSEALRQQNIDESAPFIGGARKWLRQQVDNYTGKTAAAHEHMGVYLPTEMERSRAHFEEFRTTSPMFALKNDAFRRAGIDERYPGQPVDLRYTAPQHTKYVTDLAEQFASAGAHRGNIGGERHYEHLAATMGPNIAHDTAKGESARSRDAFEFATFRQMQAQQQYDRFKRQRDSLEAQIKQQEEDAKGGAKSPDTIWGKFGVRKDTLEPLMARAELERANNEVLEARRDLQDRIGISYQKQVEYAKAVHNETRAALEVSRAEMTLLKEKEQRVQQRAQGAGAMNRVELQLALNALETIKNHGLESVTMEMRQRAKGIDTGGYIKGLEERQGEKNLAEYGYQQRIGSRDREGNYAIRDTETLPEARMASAKAEANFQVNFAINQEQLAKQIAIAVKESLGIDAIIKIIKENSETEQMRIRRMFELFSLGKAFGNG